MKKAILILGVALSILACNKSETSAKEFKTAYIDTAKLLEENVQAQEMKDRYNVKSEEMGRELQAEAKNFQTDFELARAQAQVKGPAWAQAKGEEMQRREEQLNIKQQALVRQIQEESGKEMDSLVKDIKDFISDYAKKNDYDYVYDSPGVIYAKESNDITKEITKLLNDKYKSSSKKDDKVATKEEDKK
jgi:outer membrane protein